MADRKESSEFSNSEFLGGGPKFNVVGKDNRPVPGQEEPAPAVNRSGYVLRAALFGVLILVMAAVLFYLNDQNIGKTVVAPSHSGQAVSPDAKNTPPPADLR